MKKQWWSVTIILAAVSIFAVVWYFCVARPEHRHNAVLQEYQALISAAENYGVDVTESGVCIGTVSLADMGVLDETRERITAIYSDLDRMSAEQFRALDYRTKHAWLREEHPHQTAVTIPTDGFDARAALAALNAPERIAPQNAKILQEDGRFFVAQAVDGNTISIPAVSDALYELLQGTQLMAQAPAHAVLELSDGAFYLRPQITTENTHFDLQAAFDKALAKMQITVHFHNSDEVLQGQPLADLMMLGDDGSITVRADALDAQLQQWRWKHRGNDVNYVFDSFLDGPQLISFLYCDYEIDLELLKTQLLQLLTSMQSGELEAEYLCVDNNGQPFGLGDSYIEVDVTNQHMAYFQDGELVVDTDVVTGKYGVSSTPSGLFYNNYNDVDQWLIGEDYACFVSYWVGLTYEIGIHDATWRSQFGGDIYLYGGTHGCINTPTEPMRIIYETIDIEQHIPILVYRHMNLAEPARHW